MNDAPLNVKRKLRELQAEGAVEFHERVGLREWTTLRVGGTADLLIRCQTVSAVQQVVDLLASHGMNWLVLGAGSRLVIADRGVRVPVLNLTGELARWEVDLDGLVAGAGAKLTQVGGSVARAGLSGMERLFGAPGSVGGAIQSVAIGDREDLRPLVEWIELVQPGRGATRFHRPAGTDGKVEDAVCQPRHVVVRARFGLRADELAAIQSRIAAVDAGIGGWRTRCAAPAFHAPSGHNAATLLADAGCQGMKVGGAQISNQLANAIVTGRVASSSDVLELCCNVVDRVRERCRVTLQPSLWFVDERGQRLVG